MIASAPALLGSGNTSLLVGTQFPYTLLYQAFATPFSRVGFARLPLFISPSFRTVQTHAHAYAYDT